MRRLHCMTMFVALVAIAGCGGELSTPQASDGEELLPQDPAGLTYEDEPDAWAEAPGTVGEGEAAGVYAIDSCRLHNGIANGNYTRLTPYQVAALAHRVIPRGHDGGGLDTEAIVGAIVQDVAVPR